MLWGVSWQWGVECQRESLIRPYHCRDGPIESSECPYKTLCPLPSPSALTACYYTNYYIRSWVSKLARCSSEKRSVIYRILARQSQACR